VARNLPQYYQCGICEHYHPVRWDGDCRDDSNRYAPDEIDAKHGRYGWTEVAMPGTEEEEKT
jgi:hypothetical protein